MLPTRAPLYSEKAWTCAEAPIYYSNQGGPLLQQDNPANALPNRRVVQQKFEEFLRAFSSDQGSFQYRYTCACLEV